MKPRNKNPWKYATVLNLLPLYVFVVAVGVYAGSKSFSRSVSAAPAAATTSADFSCTNFCGTFVRCLKDNGSLTTEHRSMVPAIQDGCFSGCNKHQGMISSCYQGTGTGCEEMVSCFQDRLRGIKAKPSVAETRNIGG